MFDNDILITKIDKIILVDDNIHGQRFSNYNHVLPTNEIYCSIEGDVDVTLNKHQYNVVAGDVVVLSQMDHKRYTVERNKLSICIDIYFSTQKPIMMQDFKKISCADKPKIQALFQKAFKIWVSKKDGYYYRCVGILYEILSLLQEKNYIPDKKYNLIKPAVEYIENHFADSNFKYSILSEKCSVSYGYFKKLFVEKFGVVPTKYVTLLRVNYACDLLKTGDYSVSEVAALVGIDDIYYFSKLFKNETGVSPSHYK